MFPLLNTWSARCLARVTRKLTRVSCYLMGYLWNKYYNWYQLNQSPEPVCVVWIVNWEVHRLNGANGRSWQEIECGVSISVSGYRDNLRTVLSTTRTGQTVCLFVCFEYFYCIYNNTFIQRVWTKVFTTYEVLTLK